jgi:hypothetical protein
LLASVVSVALAEQAEAVATAESFALAFDHDDVDAWLGVGPLHRCSDLVWRAVVDGVWLLGVVK